MWVFESGCEPEVAEMFWLTPTIRGLKGALRAQAFCLHGVRKKEGGQRCRRFQAGGAGSSLATRLVRAVF
jgi:hypothetical protein